jgi:hypothetical protein
MTAAQTTENTVLLLLHASMLHALPSNSHCLQSHHLATGLYATIYFYVYCQNHTEHIYVCSMCGSHSGDSEGYQLLGCVAMYTALRGVTVHINTLCGLNAKCFNVRAGCLFNYYCVLKGEVQNDTYILWTSLRSCRILVTLGTVTV